MRRNSTSRRGNSTLEFTLVGIPLIFVLISIFEISRGMWTYHTLAYAVRTGVRFAAVHGENCDPAASPTNSCLQTVATVSQVIKDAGVGLIPSDLTLEFRQGAAGGIMSSYAACTLSNCLTNTTQYPPPGANRIFLDDVEITATYPFRSAIALVWAGANSTQVFPAYNLPASSREVVEF
jgi:Flp pilus assembly protein TadG